MTKLFKGHRDPDFRGVDAEHEVGVANLKQKALEGFGWTGLNRIGKQVVQFGISIVLARLLFPRDYGLVGMAAVFIGLGRILADLGFGGAVVQKKELTQIQLSSVFWLNVVTGVVLWGIACLSAPWLARFYSTPEVGPIFIVSSLSFVFATASAVPRALIYKALRFRETFLLDWGGMILGGASSIGAAAAGLGYWSLVIGNLVSPLVATVLAWRFCGWRPKLAFELSALRDIAGFGSYYLGFQLFRYLTGNIDYLIIGKFLSATELGLYTMAFRLIEIPRSQLSGVILSVMYPVFAIVQDDEPRTQRGLQKTLLGVSLLVFPILFGLAAVAPQFIGVVYGPKWSGVSVLLRALTPAGLVYSVEAATAVLLSRGKAKAVFLVTAGRTAALLVSLLIGIQTGSLLVVAVVVSCVVAITGIPYQLWAYQQVGFGIKDFGHSLTPALVLSSLMAVAVYGMSFTLSFTALRSVGALGLEVLIGAMLYGAGLMAWPWEPLRELRRSALRDVRRRGRFPN